MPSAAENHEVKRVNKFTGEYPQNYCFSYKQTRKKSLLLHKIRIFADKYLLGERIKTTYYFFCPRITRIFVQASAEPNDCVKPNEQNRVYSNFAMASNRTFKNLFEFCRAQPKMSKKFTRISASNRMATCSVARIFTNSIRLQKIHCIRVISATVQVAIISYSNEFV